MAKRPFKTGTVKIGANSYILTDLKYDAKIAKIDVTDTGTVGDGKEYITSRTERTFQFNMWNSGSMLPLGTLSNLEINFDGLKYTGSGSLESYAVDGQIDNAIKTTYQGYFVGAVSESLA